MKLFSKFILFFTIALVSQLNLNSMEAPKTSQNLNQMQIIQQLPLNQKQELTNHFDKLPVELKLVILQHLSQANTAKSIKEIFENLRPIRAVNWEFYNLVNDKNFLRTIITEYLSKKTKEEIDKEFLDAAQNGYTPVVKAILLVSSDPKIDYQANQDLINKALIYASEMGYIEIVKLLLNRNADPNIQDNNGNTALMDASSYGHTDIVKILLSAGANPNIQNKYGYTALMVAVVSDSIDTVKVFLSNRNIDIYIKNNKGDTALDLAKKFGYKEIVDLFIN